MKARPARLRILVLVIFWSLLCSQAQAENPYYSSNSRSSESSYSGGQDGDGSYSNNYASRGGNTNEFSLRGSPVSGATYYPDYNSRAIFGNLNSPGSAPITESNYRNFLSTSSSYSSPTVISPLNYNGILPSGGAPSNSGRIINIPSDVNNYPNSYSVVSNPVPSSLNLNSFGSTPITGNSLAISGLVPNSYSNPTVISPLNYSGTLPAGSQYMTPVEAYKVAQSLPVNYTGTVPVAIGGSTYNYQMNNGVVQAYIPSVSQSDYRYSAPTAPVASSYASQSANRLPSSPERAQTMYNKVTEIFNLPLVKQAESSQSLTVVKRGGYGLDSRSNSPVAYAEVTISPHNPVIGAMASAINEGHETVVMTGEGVLTGNSMKGNSKSIVINNNNPTLIGPNNLYSMYKSTADLGADLSSHSTYRSTADLTEDFSAYNTGVVATANRPTSVTQTGIYSIVNPTPTDMVNTNILPKE